MNDALVLPGDKYRLKIRKLEEDVKEMARENAVLKKRDIEQTEQIAALKKELEALQKK